ncbi:putative aquaporin 5 [Mycena alexandri]|uniref:Aquaporin 5 n=1 Tax=Mycena alexandri TaxID=1745969 RepID=A0AAD6WN78_9AGAR|nr:putative aquaporin 5 [Mycena alexandri]
MSDASFITSTPHTSTTRLRGGHAPAPQSTFSRCREILREPIAEFLGVAVLVIFGAGVNCQVLLSSASGVSSSPKGDYLSVCFGWAVGLSLGVWVSNGISPGHINPAVTLAMATWRGFSWKKVPGFILAQILGGFVGAALIYANYSHAIDIFEGGAGVRTMKTAGVFGAYAVDYLPNGSAFFSEALGTAVLVLVIIATTDAGRGAAVPPAGLFPLVIFVTLLGISAALGMQTSFSLNPARDFGPRLLSAAVGYRGAVFSYRSQYWLWTGVLGPVVGAQVAAGLYDLFLYNGPDGVVGKRTGGAKHGVNHATDAV